MYTWIQWSTYICSLGCSHHAFCVGRKHFTNHFDFKNNFFPMQTVSITLLFYAAFPTKTPTVPFATVKLRWHWAHSVSARLLLTWNLDNVFSALIRKEITIKFINCLIGCLMVRFNHLMQPVPHKGSAPCPLDPLSPFACARRPQRPALRALHLLTQWMNVKCP